MPQLPGNCVLCAAPCGSRTLSLCQGCENELPWQPPGCHCCAVMLGREGDSPRHCAACLRNPPHFDTCQALFEYCAPVQDLISDFKYRARLAAGDALGTLLDQAFQRHYQSHKGDHRGQQPPQLLVPVPLHPQRLRQRGYNQAIELARCINRLAQVPLDGDSCQRRSRTAAQRSLRAVERASNLRDAFRLVPGTRLPAHVAVIDDVVTTTATVNELARCLRAAGAVTIDVWALARVN